MKRLLKVISMLNGELLAADHVYHSFPPKNPPIHKDRILLMRKNAVIFVQEKMDHLISIVHNNLKRCFQRKSIFFF